MSDEVQKSLLIVGENVDFFLAMVRKIQAKMKRKIETKSRGRGRKTKNSESESWVKETER